MFSQPAVEAEAGPSVLGLLSRSTQHAVSRIPIFRRERNAGVLSSHRQYEAQRNAWADHGRGLQGRRSDGLSEGSWRAVVADILPARTTSAFMITCLLWYLTSALSSNTSKALLSSPKNKRVAQDIDHALSMSIGNSSTTAVHNVKAPPPFPYPVTLTLIQFIFIHLLSSAVASPMIMRLLPGSPKPVTRIVSSPGWKRISEMAKLSIFNVVGHALSTVAISRVPVSTVHTIKALTPLFTVMSFRYLFGVHYSILTYTSLLPLTLGVMMACTSLSFSANDLFGLATALASTFIFVAQSIYSKNLVGKGAEASSAKAAEKAKATGVTQEGKLDKINILYYTSACSVVIMIPMALYYDAPKLYGAVAAQRQVALAAVAASGGAARAASTGWVTWLVFANGLSQFAQNFLAFSVLALVSPVTYSIASLFKRVFVICFAIIWFGQSVSKLQWAGIILTFVGLYMYNDAKTSKSAAAKEEAATSSRNGKDTMLPTTVHNAGMLFNPSGPSTPLPQQSPKASQSAFMPHQQQEALEPLFQQGGVRGSSSEAQLGESTISMDSQVPAHGESGRSRTARFSTDPRQSIPSPPPSRGPSSDDDKESATRLARTSALR